MNNQEEKSSSRCIIISLNEVEAIKASKNLLKERIALVKKSNKLIRLDINYFNNLLEIYEEFPPRTSDEKEQIQQYTEQISFNEAAIYNNQIELKRITKHYEALVTLLNQI